MAGVETAARFSSICSSSKVKHLKTYGTHQHRPTVPSSTVSCVKLSHLYVLFVKRLKIHLLVSSDIISIAFLEIFNKILSGNIGRQPLLDYIFEGCKRPAGPFPSVKDFNDYFIDLLWTGPGLPPIDGYIHPMRPGLPDDLPMFFTHADLTPSNIIVSSSPSGQLTIVAIIDWHQSGWYPAYWEACKSISNADPDSEWGQGLPSVFVPYSEFLRSFAWMISAGVAI
jgi:Phosphotransferase enzyme family